MPHRPIKIKNCQKYRIMNNSAMFQVCPGVTTGFNPNMMVERCRHMHMGSVQGHKCVGLNADTCNDCMLI